MKKLITQIPKYRKGLNLGKRTISNLDASQLNLKVGGNRTNGKSCDGAYSCVCYWTHKNRTCHNCGSF